MEIRSLARDDLSLDNGLMAQRLMPWQALNAPFEGSWCVVRPGAASGPHGHHEHEIWIAVSGSAEILAGGRRVPCSAGDIIRFPPDMVHQVVNNGDADFEMYAVWWDSGLAEKYLERRQAEM